MKNLTNRICVHGYEVTHCSKEYVFSREEMIQMERERFRKMFTRKELKNPVTMSTYILKMQQFRLRELYVNIPKTLLYRIPGRNEISEVRK